MRKSLRKGAGFALIVPAIALLLNGSLVSASTTARTKAKLNNSASTVKPDVSYFAGKTINWIIPQAPGTSFYTSASILAPLVGSYLHATVTLSSDPAGATIVGQDAVGSAAPNALTIGTLSLGNDIYDDVTNTPGINFPLKKAAIIAGEPLSPATFVACLGSPFSSWAQVVAGKGQFTSLATTGTVEEKEQILFGAYGLQAHILSGYSSAAVMVAGCLHGDGSMGDQAVADWTPQELTTVVKPLFVSSPVAKGSIYYSVFKNVPTIAQFAAKHPPKTKRGKAAMKLILALYTAPNQVVFAPPGTPQKYLAALTAAFRSAMLQTATKNAFNAAGLQPGYLGAAPVRKSIIFQLNAARTVSAYLSYGVSGYGP